MIIDAHNHPEWHGHDLKKYLENMDRLHIDKCWLLSWEAPESEYDPETIYAFNLCINNAPAGERSPAPFSLCVDYKQRAPERFILGYAPDPRRPEAIQLLRAALKLYDVRTCGEVKLRMMYDNPDAIDLFRFCGEAGLPVTLHLDYASATATGREFPRRNWWYGGGIEVLERVLELCPNTNFLGHAPGFWSHISNDDLIYSVAYPKGPVIPGGRLEKVLEKYPNIYCDISAGSGCNALSRDKEYTRRLMLRFPDRFCYARDCFENIHQELIESLELPQNVKELIYSGNAQRLIGE